MRTNINALKLLLCAFGLMLCACTEEDVEDVKAQVPGKMSFVVVTGDLSDVRMSSVDDVQKIFISISDGQGNVVYQKHELKILKFEDYYLTEFLQMNPGHYQVTEFLVADKDNKILFATPLKDSPLANQVTRPLPIDFTIEGDVIDTLPMEVISCENKEPEDFGLIRFSITFVNLLTIGLPDTEQPINRLTYRLVADGDTIFGEIFQPGHYVKIPKGKLSGNTFQARFELFLEEDATCLTRMLEFNKELVFENWKTELPPVVSIPSQWKPWIYEEQNNIQVFHTEFILDTYTVQFRLPGKGELVYADLFSRPHEWPSVLCGMDFYESSNPEGTQIEINLTGPRLSTCSQHGQPWGNYYVDSMIRVMMHDDTEFYLWRAWHVTANAFSFLRASCSPGYGEESLADRSDFEKKRIGRNTVLK